MTFETWMVKVDKVLVSKCGLGYMDLPDCCYWDMWDSEMTPTEAAHEALSNAGYPDGVLYV